MSCYNINEFAHVMFGEIGVSINLPADEQENKDAIEDITNVANEVGATWVSINEPAFFKEEFFDKEKLHKNKYFNGPYREIRVYGELRNNTKIRETLLNLQEKYGQPDAEYIRDLRKWCR